MVIYQSQLFGSVNRTQIYGKMLSVRLCGEMFFNITLIGFVQKEPRTPALSVPAFPSVIGFWKCYLGLRVIRGISISSREMPPCWKVPS